MTVEAGQCLSALTKAAELVELGIARRARRTAGGPRRPADRGAAVARRPGGAHRRRGRVQAGQEFAGQRAGRGRRLPGRRRRRHRGAHLRAARRAGPGRPALRRRPAAPGADRARRRAPATWSRAAAVAGRPPGERVAGVEIQLPRKLLAGGLVLVDTPGVGGLGSAHAAASLAAISMADAVLFVTDASQELTRSELDFLRQARELCRTVVCVLTKTDFYPAWRTIRDLDERPPARSIVGRAADGGVVVAARPRGQGQRHRAQHRVRLRGPGQVRHRPGRRRARPSGSRAEAAAEVVAVCDQIAAQFEAERAALADPEAAQRVVDELNAAQGPGRGAQVGGGEVEPDAQRRRRRPHRRHRPRPARPDPRGAAGGRRRGRERRPGRHLAADGVLAAVAGLLRAAGQLRAAARRGPTRSARRSAEHFREASGEVFDQLAVYNPTPLLSGTRVEHKIELEKMKAGKQAMVALKSAYGGVLMFTMLGAHDRHRARPARHRHRPGDGPQGTARREEAPADAAARPRPATRSAATATR